MSRPPLNPPQGAPDPADEEPSSTMVPRGRPESTVVRPRQVAAIAVIVAAEAVALLAIAVLWGYQLVSGPLVLPFWGDVFFLVLLLAFSSWLFAVGHFLFRGYRWPRAGALVAQLFVLAIGFPTLTGGDPIAGLSMLLPAVVAIGLLFDKRVIHFASRAGGSPPAL
ncbi:hypothetical protein [Pseudarthrobacter sp. N5]|uniref:hypothetical protein n=1 Tax=Pseudarthrobacter sp. N5 TaxID=3418416 RepID=UPI003CFB0701